jgi:hypothetical protein
MNTPAIVTSTRKMQPNLRYVLGLLAAALATASVYCSGLHGGFVFDDYPNIVDNPDVHLASLSIQQLKAAAFSAPPGAAQRPIASLTFALNWWISPGSAFAMKSVNVLIHVANGLLLYFMLNALLGAAAAVEKRSNASQALPLAVATCWMLAPINLTCVLYVVQRMESLCQLFVVAGLWGYFAGRHMTLSDPRLQFRGQIISCGSILFGGALGMLAKESAVLLPLYAFLAEFSVLRFRGVEGNFSLRFFLPFAALLFIPGIVGLAWLLPHVLSPAVWANRDFSLEQRLLTEARVVIDYLFWTLAPYSPEFNLYHDDFSLSTGLFTPWSTSVAIFGISVLLIASAVLARRMPLASLGILWFFSAHLLTATLVPLEIAFEHRNYFASIGIFLALFAAILQAAQSVGNVRLWQFAVIAFAAWYGGTTFNRAREWGDATQLAIGEAQRNPGSVRANYQAGKILISMSNYEQSPLVEAGEAYFNHAAALPGTSILPEQALIIVANRTRHRNDIDSWQRLVEKLHVHAPSEENVAALAALSECFIQKQCVFGAAALDIAFAEATQYKPVRADLTAVYTNYLRVRDARP